MNHSSSHQTLNHKKYGVLFFETFQEAKAAGAIIQQNCQTVDQLNVVIKSEGVMDDPELLDLHQKVKVFAGSAWHLIHTRRKDEGWYDESNAQK